MSKKIHHQFGLFGFIEPTGKVPLRKQPISKERIEEAKREMAKGNYRSLTEMVRDVGDHLDSYCNRISNKQKDE